MFWDLIVLAMLFIGIAIFGRIFFDLSIMNCVIMYAFAGFIILLAFFMHAVSLALM